MYYIRLSEEDPNSIVYYCRNCGHENKNISLDSVTISKTSFKHNKQKYGLPLPIWVACEVWDFGCMSTLFAGLTTEMQDNIAAAYGVRDGRVFASWLRSLNYLRNVCAHHSRLWKRNIVDQPRLPSEAEMPWVAGFERNSHALARCFLLLRILRQLLGVINPRSSWPDRMHEHLASFPELGHLGLNVAGMGAPMDWPATWT